MKPPVIWGMVLVLLLLVGIGGYWGLSALLKDSETQVTIPPEVVADYVHAVIQANRTVYTTNVVDKMQESGIVAAAEHWKGENALPLPAQFLMETGRLVAESGKGIKYKLVSLWPIYVWNKPETEFERKGLEAVAKSPERPFTGFVRIGRERYFQAIYADVAVSQACVTCHNQHINSSRRDFKLHDVMGGIVITIPVSP
ncbi:MAG: DUF3365 domain-containing protein [Nitrospirota bacterium]|nr:DUF3365 domain-containing protein [Nitrospirota bacterium]